MINRLINLFPLWAILISVIAFIYPEVFSSLKNIIMPLLALVMFSMGMTLGVSDFKAVIKKPLVIAVAVSIQFLFMPLLAYGISKLLSLPLDLMTGMVLVGVSAGGTASNVICYLAKGNVALSILMTVTSTLLAVVLMPALTYFYLDQLVPVPVLDMLRSICLIVLLPVISGTLINSIFNQKIEKLQVFLPLLSCFSIILIIAIIVGLNHQNLNILALPVFIAVCLHNLCGLLIGYGIPKMLKFDEPTCRTVCIEVAMQNSGLSVALAAKYFSITAALPGAIFSIWHNLSGSVLALYWRSKKADKIASKKPF